MNKFLKLIFILSITLLASSNVFAANITSTSDKTNVTENQTFVVTVATNTTGSYINSAEGVISFPQDLVSAESVSTSGSIFSIWVEQPNYSNINGTVSFNGGVPTPGFNGSNGKILSIVFRAKKAGVANIAFSSASIYQNDGLGTNILSLRNGTSVNITTYKGPETEKEIIELSKLPASPVITSVDMPDVETWYSLNKATFSWGVPQDVTSVQLLFSKLPDSVPTVTYTPAIEQKTITDLNDGIYYLHARFKNSAGWGKTTHRKIKIDNTPPTNLNVVSSITKNDNVNLDITSQDATSSLSKYKISIDGVFLLEVVPDKTITKVNLPFIEGGNHEVGVIAYDKAGNLSEKVVNILFPEIKAPKITDYPKSIIKRGEIEISGKSYPLSDIRIWLQFENEEAKSYVVKTLEDGSFTFVSNTIPDVGLVSIWAEVVKSDQAVSASSEKYFVLVNNTAFMKKSLITFEMLSAIISISLLFIILLFIIYHAYHRLKKMRRRLLQDINDTEDESHKIFSIIKDDVKQSLKILKSKNIKEKLKEEDLETIETLTKDIKEAEDYFEKKLKSIVKKDL